MLAYCTAANLSYGLLVYTDKGKPSAHKIKHAGKTIEVASLGLAGAPEDILAEVRRLAGHIEYSVMDRPEHRLEVSAS